ncbi:ubiquitin-like domain-containing protein [Virgibacillus oceani]
MRVFSKLMPASTMKLVMSGVGILALVVFSGFILFEATKAEVVIIDNNKEQTIQTHQSTVEEVLDEVGITVGQYDGLSHELDDNIENNMEIDYQTAKEIIVTLNGDENEYYTTTATIGEFFNENNFNFAERDEISHKTSDEIEDGLHIEISQAFQITVNDGGDKKEVWATGGSVEELLADENIDFDPDSNDKINFATGSKLAEGMNIDITRVEKRTEEVTEAVAFDTEERNDSSLLKGEEEVVTQGEDGELTKVYEITLENGEQVDKQLVDEQVKKESTNRIVAIGTKEPQPEPEQNVVTLSSEKPKSGSSESTSKNSGSSDSTTSSGSSSSKEFTMSSTAYTANCNGCSGYTATGINLNANPNKKVVAVDPSVIPLGSRVWVEGYGEAIAGDTGGSIVGNKIDVHVPNQAAASSWGRKTVTVKKLD